MNQGALLRIALVGGLLFLAAVLLATSFSAAGIEVSHADGSAVYTIAWWVQLGFLLFLVLGVAGTWALGFWTSGPLTHNPVFVVVVIYGVMGPTIYQEEVRVNADRLQATGGFWFMAQTVSARFADLQEIRVTRGAKNRYLVCVSKSGAQQSVPFTTSLASAFGIIKANARSHGVRVTEA